jgi:putative transposase
MLNLLCIVLASARASLKSRRDLTLENLALRQQLAVLGRQAKRPKLTRIDRAFWVALTRLWPDWRRTLTLVKPATVIAWANDNIGWGAPRIHGELLKLGFTVSEATVSRYMPQPRAAPPSQTWRSFLDNHMHCAAAIDFFVVPTATFRLLYVFVVLEHARRRILHVNVTDQPSARWTAQQIINAFEDRQSATFARPPQAAGLADAATGPGPEMPRYCHSAGGRTLPDLGR